MSGAVLNIVWFSLAGKYNTGPMVNVFPSAAQLWSVQDVLRQLRCVKTHVRQLNPTPGMP